ncbi:MAG: CHAP domain-containing protein [Atribacterota bacterium]|nr:CHAP domain-containing protein [Atribacterota bacterium]
MKIEKKYWPWIGFGIAVIGLMVWQQRKIIRQAKKFLGVSEIGDNMDWDNAEFKKKLQAVGWTPGSQWCVYFAKAMMVDVYPELKTKTHKGKKLMDYISGNSQQTYANMKTLETETGGMFKIVAVPRAGDIVIWQNYGTDGVATSKGHVGIVTFVKGDSFKTIEGNTSELGDKEEGVNKKDHSLGEYKKTKGLRLKGFVRYTLK